MLARQALHWLSHLSMLELLNGFLVHKIALVVEPASGAKDSAGDGEFTAWSKFSSHVLLSL